MRRRIAIAIIAVAALAVALFAIPLAVVVQRFVDERGALQLERRAVLASRQVPGDFATTADPVELPSGGTVSYGLYEPSGRRVTGTGPDRGGPLVHSAATNTVAQAEQGEHRVVAIPIVDHEQVVGVLRASQPTQVADARANRSVLLIAALGLAVLAIGALVARVLAARLARPVIAIRDQAVQLGDGDFNVELEPTGIADLDELGDALSATAERLDDLVGRERAFSADASHQLRTPLAALRTNLETELEFPRASSSLVLREALEDVSRLEATIDQLLRFARRSTVTLTSTLIAPLIESARNDWNGRFAALDRPLVVSVGEADLEVTGAPDLLRQALDVLLDNAFVHGAGRVQVRVRSTIESVTISVTDAGPGFAPPPTGEDDAVHGLGLPLARRLIESCGGRLIIAEPGSGPTVDLVLLRSPVTGPQATGPRQP